MSSNNLGLYEDLTKIIIELSSNIIKYAPYFFCWCRLIRAFVLHCFQGSVALQAGLCVTWRQVFLHRDVAHDI